MVQMDHRHMPRQATFIATNKLSQGQFALQSSLSAISSKSHTLPPRKRLHQLRRQTRAQPRPQPWVKKVKITTKDRKKVLRLLGKKSKLREVVSKTNNNQRANGLHLWLEIPQLKFCTIWHYASEPSFKRSSSNWVNCICRKLHQRPAFSTREA